MRKVVAYTYTRRVSVKSDWARSSAAEVAAAASLGLISTYLDGTFTRYWRPTSRGVSLLEST